MWQGRCIYPGLPSASGKRGSGRGRHRRDPAVHNIAIKYTPHVRIRLGHRTLRALLDTGSEISLVNARTARQARTLGIRPTTEEAQIHLANGTAADTLGSITLPINLQGQQLQHPFRILPTLDSPMLIVVDLWARLQLTLTPPPPDPAASYGQSCATASGLIIRTPQEEQKLKAFLLRELAHFDDI